MAHKKMTKAEFSNYFREEVLPEIARHEQGGRIDRPARREAWNDTVDAFIKNDDLPESAGNWAHPKWLETEKIRVVERNPKKKTTKKKTGETYFVAWYHIPGAYESDWTVFDTKAEAVEEALTYAEITWDLRHLERYDIPIKPDQYGVTEVLVPAGTFDGEDSSWNYWDEPDDHVRSIPFKKPKVKKSEHGSYVRYRQREEAMNGNPKNGKKKRKNASGEAHSRGDATLAAGLGSLGGALVGSVLGPLGAEVGSIAGAVAGGHYYAPPGSMRRTMTGAGIGGVFGPVGAAIGGYVGAGKPDGQRGYKSKNPDEHARVKRMMNPRNY